MSPTVQALEVDESKSAYYAPATVRVHGNTIYVSGQAGVQSDGLVPSDYESQIYLALVALRKILITASATVADILKLTLYIVNYDADNRKHAKPLQKFLNGHRPAITLVPVAQLADQSWLFEMDAVVAQPSSTKILGQSRPTPSQRAERPDVDVVIIGAGLAGLTAAERIIKAGFSCLILEARGRVGGRTSSQPLSDGQGIIEMGAAWLNRTNQSRTIALAKRFGAELIQQNTTGKCVLQDGKGNIIHFPYGDVPDIQTTTKDHLIKIRDTIENDCQKVDRSLPRDPYLDSITFAEYLRSHGADPDAVATATLWTRAMLGQEPEDISALFFLHYCKSGGGLLQMRSDREHGGQFLRVRQGTQHLANSLAASLPAKSIRLSSPVTTVESLDTRRIQISGPNVNVTAHKVISAVPPPVLSKLTFIPALPSSKMLLASSHQYGFYRKVMVSFRSPFWVNKGFCGLVQSFHGPISVIRDTSVPADNKHVLTCFMAGSPGEKWSQLPPKRRKEALLHHIGDVFGEPTKVKELVIEILDYAWNEDSFSGYGCPSASLPPGVLSSVADVTRDAVGDIYFIGTETAEEWKGYMEGAIRSGERGALEVIHDLNHIPPKI
ncbi:Amine oxidase [Metarhizium robertsii ARSEF 23]|uniref:Amine oxidase n=1 Tax=Metarhizium robertsii (strain ARSEF 23 / ATCC MYA-3075) TaxID=655844 RepID=E9FDD2_METRA|nr:Amine oxidase [Metarhizium robertsii ARSEF 23]EFY94246.1 Amine oxidase [Metarhizium robertsii ARSEF 23]